MIFWYTRFLEEQVRVLQNRVEALEARNQELVLSIVNRTPLPEQKPVEPKHLMAKGEGTATCSCGWKAQNADPAILQSQIAEHYRKNVISGSHRKSWTQIRTTLEQEAEGGK